MQSEKGPLLDINEVYDSEDNDFVSSHSRDNKLQRIHPCWARALRKGLCLFVITGLLTYYLGLSHGMSSFSLLECVANMIVLMTRLSVC